MALSPERQISVSGKSVAGANRIVAKFRLLKVDPTDRSVPFRSVPSVQRKEGGFLCYVNAVFEKRLGHTDQRRRLRAERNVQRLLSSEEEEEGALTNLSW